MGPCTASQLSLGTNRNTSSSPAGRSRRSCGARGRPSRARGHSGTCTALAFRSHRRRTSHTSSRPHAGRSRRLFSNACSTGRRAPGRPGFGAFDWFLMSRTRRISRRYVPVAGGPARAPARARRHQVLGSAGAAAAAPSKRALRRDFEGCRRCAANHRRPRYQKNRASPTPKSLRSRRHRSVMVSVHQI